jgi:hypothetical protein
MSPLVNLASDLSRIAECKIVFGGNENSCGNAMRFASGDWPALKTYIQNGGRLYLVGEHSGDFPAAHESFKCLQDMTNLNNFLSSIGSTIAYVGGPYIMNNDPGLSDTTPADPGDANIAQGGITFMTNWFGHISGGTSVWKANTPYYQDDRSAVGSAKTIVAVEKIGSGFVFVAGDSNMFSLTNNCDFTKRLWQYDDSQII